MVGLYWLGWWEGLYWICLWEGLYLVGWSVMGGFLGGSVPDRSDGRSVLDELVGEGVYTGWFCGQVCIGCGWVGGKVCTGWLVGKVST